MTMMRSVNRTASNFDTDNDSTFTTVGSGDEENAENMETDSSKSDLDEEEYQPLSVAEESELEDDKIYLTSSFYETILQVDKDEEMKKANNVILLSVNHIISTVSSTLYALSIHWAKETDSAWYFSIPDFDRLSLVFFHPRLHRLKKIQRTNVSSTTTLEVRGFGLVSN